LFNSGELPWIYIPPPQEAIFPEINALLIKGDDRAVKKVAWCTGGAQNGFEQAIDLGADVYISGEVSENTFHLAKESGVHYLAAGHHATERFGVKALGQHLAEKFALKVQYILRQNMD